MNLLRFIWIFLFMLFAVISGMTQQNISGTEVLQYSIPHVNGTIDFVKIGADTTIQKPVILFLQGSLPIPLVIDVGDYKHVNIPFDAARLKGYHLIMISMPHTPVEAPISKLNDQYSYVTDTSDVYSFDEGYVKANYLENYIQRTCAVLDHLKHESWVDSTAIHLVGHSQGAKIAAVVAAQHPLPKTVSFLAFNAFGRYDEIIRRERSALQTGKISGEIYLSNLEMHYNRWKEIQKHPEDIISGNKSWASFSVDYRPFLLEIDIPMFFGYGTEDISSQNGDLLPLEFIKYGKTNYILKPYVGWDHNFFDVNDRQKGHHWDEVMEDVVEWSAKTH